MPLSSPRQLSDLGHAQRERFRFIEATLLWEGTLQRERVSRAFGLSLNHVTRVLRDYDAAYPDSLSYDHRRQSYTIGRRFRPQFASRDPAEYLALQLAFADSGSAVVEPWSGGDAMPVVTVPAPPLGIDARVLQHILRAIGSQQGLDMIYHSTRATAPGHRYLWPHALVHTGVRWHVRAYDGKSEAFRNFAMQRIEAPKPLVKPTPVSPEADSDWVHSQKVRVIPNPQLNAHQQQLVARDFGMTSTDAGPAWTVSLRQCLIAYFVNRYGLASTGSKQRIILADPDPLRRWFLPSDSD